jgi:hypothetical protein
MQEQNLPFPLYQELLEYSNTGLEHDFPNVENTVTGNCLLDPFI